ncbi:hypothetical protein HAX54_044695 [Datura stramonium]|uniref:Uncharacterized protein n=1 Tax=Datura stramonium TaxID=4076 RepID=A0ABS8WH66_DATST|nr:hypothetical protein [Datura stramonium]
MVEGSISSLREKVRELRSRTPIANHDVSFFDEAIAATHTVRGPIDDLLMGLGEDDEDWTTGQNHLLREKVRILEERVIPIANHDVSFFDEAPSLHTHRGPIDDLLMGLGRGRRVFGCLG